MSRPQSATAAVAGAPLVDVLVIGAGFSGIGIWLRSGLFSLADYHFV